VKWTKIKYGSLSSYLSRVYIVMSPDFKCIYIGIIYDYNIICLKRIMLCYMLYTHLYTYRHTQFCSCVNTCLHFVFHIYTYYYSYRPTFSIDNIIEHCQESIHILFCHCPGGRLRDQCRNNRGGRVCNAFPGQILCYSGGPTIKRKN